MSRSISDLVSDDRNTDCPYCDRPLLIVRETSDPQEYDPEAHVDLGDEDEHDEPIDKHSPHELTAGGDPDSDNVDWAYSCRQGCGFVGFGFPTREAMYEHINNRRDEITA